MSTSIITVSGCTVDLSADVIHVPIEDVAHSLAYKPRFNSQMNTFIGNGKCVRLYTVAHHSLRVSYLVPPQFALDALLHDAHESLTGDIPTPVKVLLRAQTDALDRMEASVTRAIRVGLGMPPEASQEATEAIGKADKAALLEEVPTCFSVQALRAWLNLGYDIDPKFRYGRIPDPDSTKRYFCARYHELTSPVASGTQSLWERHGWGVVRKAHPPDLRRDYQPIPL